MKKLLSILLLVFSTHFIHAQQTEIFGSIVDAKTKQALEYVNVICKNAKKEILTGGITDKNGKFHVTKLPNQTLLIELQFIGYKTISITSKPNLENLKINLGTISLIEDNAVLDEVEVQAETTTITQKIDRRVVNVGKDLASAGTNALQMMENIPSVTVNYQDGTISMRGNSNVRVLIDGKPSNLTTEQLLKQIPSASIQKVELITNPSAKYNPEGMSGIINFILKKNTQLGFNGSVNVGVTQGENTRPNAGVDLNYRNGKFNFYGNYNYDFGKLNSFTDLRRTDKDLYQAFDFEFDAPTHVAKIGIDLYLNDKNTLSLYTNQTFSNEELITKGRILENNIVTLNSNNSSKFDVNEGAYNLDYKLNIDDKGQNLEIETMFTRTKTPEFDNNTEAINPLDKRFNFTNNITNNNDLWLVNVDYTKPFSESSKLELGAEARIQNTENTIVTDQEITVGNPATIQPRGNTDFTYDRNIYSFYTNYNHDFEQFSLQAGVRLEQFEVEGIFNNTQQTNTNTYQDDIFSVYPSAYLTYFPTDNDEFQIGYSRRVDRPGIEQVSPIQEWTTPLTISTGNQTLEPQFTNSIELNYTRTIKSGYIYAGTFFRKISDQIGRLVQVDPTNPDRQILSYTNYGNSNSFGVEVMASFKPAKWWTLSPSTEVNSQDNNGIINAQNISVTNTVFNATMQNNFKISKRLSATFTGLYRGTSKNVQFTRNDFYMFNAGAKLSVFDGRGSISVRGSDIFNTLDLSFSSTQPVPQIGTFDQEFRNIFIGFTYNFGSSKYKALERKEREQNETQGSGGVL